MIDIILKRFSSVLRIWLDLVGSGLIGSGRIGSGLVGSGRVALCRIICFVCAVLLRSGWTEAKTSKNQRVLQRPHSHTEEDHLDLLF